MKVIYLDCAMGCAGDMLSAALLELMPEPDRAIEALNKLGIPDVVFAREKSVKCGICGTHMSVKINGAEEGEEAEHHHHHHRSMAEIEHIISSLKVSNEVKRHAMEVYTLIAEAESHVHGRCVEEVHFHEVGAMDAVADVTAVCWLFEQLGAQEIYASNVHVGCGTVRCAHGVLPVPAPATAYILRGVPCYGGGVRGELCTPTGAALLKHFVKRFGDMPIMRSSAIGYGMGKKDFETVNAVRAILGETDGAEEKIVMLHFNVDDMTAEQIAFASGRMFSAGAVEVFTVPIGMKKSRPGTLICALCSEEKRDEVISAIFKHTTTIGLRESVCARRVLSRRTESLDTPYGTVRLKISEGFGVRKEKFEYDDLAGIAKENELSLDEVVDRIKNTDAYANAS